MPAPTTIYFAQIARGSGWKDWIRLVNVSREQAKVTCVARNHAGQTVWSDEHTVGPFQTWDPPVEGRADRKSDVSLEVRSDKPIAGERHCHSGTQVLDFPGASMQNRTIATRLFFPELYAGGGDWIRILNIGEVDAQIAFVARNLKGDVVRQRAGRARKMGWWDVSDQTFGQINGTLEIMSTQPVVAERHLHYSGGRTAVGQLGIAID